MSNLLNETPTPAQEGFFFPAEWHPHAATWLTWPHTEVSWSKERLELMMPGYLDFIKAISESEPVCINAHNEIIIQQANMRLLMAGANMERITLLPFVHGAYDSVFMKDCAIVAGSSEPRALLASPLHEVRQAEQVARATHLMDAGFDVSSPLQTALEGGDVVVLRHLPGALMGHGFRSDPESARELARFLRTPVLLLELCDPSLFHLDTALTVLKDGTALVCETAFTKEALRALRSFPFAGIVPVSHEEALRFATNVVEVGDTIVTGSWAPRLAEHLLKNGRNVIYTQLDQFHRAGGSAACLVATHRKAPQPARRAVA